MAGAGWETYRPSAGIDKGRVLLLPKCDYEIPRMDIPMFFSPSNRAALELWQNWKIFGWPYSGGWAEQPARIVDVVRCLEIENNKRLYNAES